MIIPNPAINSWKTWAETFIGFNSTLSNQLWPVPEVKWKDFGRRLCQIEPQTPRPEFHKTWRDWAKALQMAIGG